MAFWSGYSEPPDSLPGQDTGTSRRAERAGRVGIGIAQPLRRECIDRWCLVKLAAIAPHIAPTQIIDNDHHDIGAFFRRAGEQWPTKCEQR